MPNWFVFIDCINILLWSIIVGTFFFQIRSTELDAVVFGHVFTLLTTPMPDNRLASIVRAYPNLVEACQFVEKIYFQAPPKVNETDDESYC